MDLQLLLLSALALAPERLTYIWISREPAAFARLAAALQGPQRVSPMHAVHHLFVGFKLLQAAVVIAWLQWHSDGAFWTHLNLGSAGIAGGLLLACGQYLNVRVFQLLGFDGVFYGNRFGVVLPYCEAFPFSVLAHPQYVGACLSIWGVFLIARFPHADWFVLPALESIYYGVSARLEK